MGGGQPPMAPVMERPLPRQAFVEPEDGKLKRKILNGEQDYDNMPEDYYYKGSRTMSHEGRHQLDKMTAGNVSDNDSPRIHKKHQDDKHYSSSHRKPATQSNEELPSAERGRERGSHHSVSGRDQLSRHSEKSNSEAQDLSDSSNRQSRDRKRHHHGICHKKQSDRRGHHASEFSPKSQHRSRKDISDDEKVAPDHRKHSHRHYPESSSEHNFASDRRQHHREKEASHGSRSSRQIPKSKDNQSDYERWEMKEGLGDEYRGEDHHKRQRTR